MTSNATLRKLVVLQIQKYTNNDGECKCSGKREYSGISIQYSLCRNSRHLRRNTH